MGIHQAIFTSSAKGLSKGGGLGIHSYSRECTENELNEFKTGFAQYEFGGAYEEISGLPTKYVYGKIMDGRYMAAEITRLQKDYDKESGRTGNLLSHMFSFAKEDMKSYPMQLYGSGDFLTEIAAEEVDGSREVAYLTSPSEVRSGSVVTIETVQNFLEAGRMEMFCHLLAAVLRRGDAHKIILLDDHAHILQWIGAIEYALPLKCAREISFSSCEKNPILASFDIRGAVPGLSEGCYEKYAESGQFYVFDGIMMRYPQFDISEDYYVFGIHMGLAFAYDSLQEFHKMMQNYSYEQADTDLYGGYRLFQLIRNGIGVLNEEEFMQAIAFEGKYGNGDGYLKLMKQLVDKMKTGAHNDRMWEKLSSVLITGQTENLKEITRYLIEEKLYRELGILQAEVLKHSITDRVQERLLKLYNGYWSSAGQEDKKQFDLVVGAAVQVLQQIEEREKRLEREVSLFLSVQELGNRTLSGPGCESLIYKIENDIVLEKPKTFQKRELHWNRHKKPSVLSGKMQARCAFEAFNYIQRNHVDLPVSRIRMQHLLGSIIRSYQEEIPVAESEILKIYQVYPIEIKGISHEELQDYFTFLAKAIFDDLVTTREDYGCFMHFWKLADDQKAIFIKVFGDVEFGYFQKEKAIEGVEALLGAVLDLGDAGYEEALTEYLTHLKPFRRKRATEAIKKTDGKIQKFWNDLCEKVERRSV